MNRKLAVLDVEASHMRDLLNLLPPDIVLFGNSLPCSSNHLRLVLDVTATDLKSGKWSYELHPRDEFSQTLTIGPRAGPTMDSTALRGPALLLEALGAVLKDDSRDTFRGYREFYDDSGDMVLEGTLDLPRLAQRTHDRLNTPDLCVVPTPQSPPAATATPELSNDVRLPAELTSEMWRAAGDAVVALQQRGVGHHDKIVEAVWQALKAFSPSATKPTPCVNHAERPAITNLDGDNLCQDCATAWVRSEGDHARYLEEEEAVAHKDGKP